MPPNRNPRRKNTSPLTAVAAAATIDPMADCVLPLDVIPCILTRLPVKSVLRFKSVCKPWCKLVASSKFVKAHHDQLSKDPQNQAAVIYSRSDYHDHTMSLYKINSGEKNPISLDHPYPGIFFRKDFLDASYGLMCRGCPPRGQGTVLWNPIFFRVDFVGACYGLLCMGCPPLGQGIVLWNPAMKLFKFVGPSKVEFEVPEMVSLGFGFDSKSDDFKVVRIVCLAEKKKGKSMGVGVEVYSANSDSWKTIEVGFRFKVLSTKNDAIVNGNPYWVVKFDEKGGAESSLGEALVCFDVTKMVFMILPFSGFSLHGGAEVLLVDWKGSLGAIVCDKNFERVDSLDVWVFDDCEKIWTKNHTFGPIELKVDRILQCSNNGMILGECPDGKLFVFDPMSGSVEEIVIDKAQKRSFVINGYSESLACVEGMEKVVVKKNVEEDGEDSEEGPDINFESFLKILSAIK